MKPLDPADDWYVNSPLDYNDFRIWVARVTDANGRMPALLQRDIAQLLGLSSSKINVAFKEGMAKLKDQLTPEDLENLFRD